MGLLQESPRNKKVKKEQTPSPQCQAGCFTPCLRLWLWLWFMAGIVIRSL